jgi:predicted O-methyltransferase YrrM
LFQILAYINYWLRQVDAHSLHSPFLFDFYNSLIQTRHKPDQVIEQLRHELLRSRQLIQTTDFGAGSRVTKEKSRKIASIAKHSSTPLKFSLFLNNLIEKYGYKHVVELGTSLGLNTLYMSLDREVRIKTFEGDPAIAKVAQQHFQKLKRKNIELIEGNIDETLTPTLEQMNEVDLAYLDANHRFEPTIRYYEEIMPYMHLKGILIFDDIHWSKDMSHAWNTILERGQHTLSIDLFEAGLIFLDPELPKEHYILRF